MSDEQREAQKAAVAQVVATFNPQQLAAWNSLIGKPFTGRVSLFGGFMGGGFGAFGGAGGPGGPPRHDRGNRGERGNRDERPGDPADERSHSPEPPDKSR